MRAFYNATMQNSSSSQALEQQLHSISHELNQVKDKIASASADNARLLKDTIFLINQSIVTLKATEVDSGLRIQSVLSSTTHILSLLDLLMAQLSR